MGSGVSCRSRRPPPFPYPHYDEIDHPGQRIHSCRPLRQIATTFATSLAAAWSDRREYDLVFVAVPPGANLGSSNYGKIDPHFTDGHSHGAKEAVFAAITDLVECPDGVIPTLVWVEASKERNDVRWEVLAPAFDYVVEISGSVRDGEVSVFQSSVASRAGCCKSRLVQSRAERFSSLEGVIGEAGGKGLRQATFMQLIDSFRIQLNDMSIWLFVEKSLDTSIEVGDLLLCAGNPALGAVECVSHDRKVRA